MLQAVHGWSSTYERLVKSQKFFSSYLTQEDLSRFGRDYIETGNYLETIFPMLHILNQKEFDEELVHELIKKIYVGIDNSVEIEFKCSDPYQEVLAFVAEVQNE